MTKVIDNVSKDAEKPIELIKPFPSDNRHIYADTNMEASSFDNITRLTNGKYSIVECWNDGCLHFIYYAKWNSGTV